MEYPQSSHSIQTSQTSQITFPFKKDRQFAVRRQAIKLIVMDQQPPKERPNPIGTFQLVTVKLSHFQPAIDTPLQHRHSFDDTLYHRREMLQTSLSQHPEQRPSTCDETTASARGFSLSKFMESEISRMRESGARLSQFSPLLKHKMGELRSIMELKRAALRIAPAPKGSVNFSEYKMTGVHPPDDQSILHSRQRQESPFMKSAKAKKYLCQSLQIRNSKPKKEKFASIEVDPASKYAPAKKMVLLGGSLRRNAATANPNPETHNEPPRSSHTSARNRNYILRRTVRYRQDKLLANELEEEGEACRPWDTQKEQEEQGL